MSELETKIDDINEQGFVLGKEIWNKYNMTLTKENVLCFMSEYKEAKAICLKSIVAKSLTINLDPNKVFMPSRVNNGGFATAVDNRLDSEEVINNTEPLLKELIKTFTPKEKIYFDYCLTNNYSEEYVMSILGHLSKNGLMPIKNSCILKFALAFDIADLKDK